jgi:hypothetical protein
LGLQTLGLLPRMTPKTNLADFNIVSCPDPDTGGEWCTLVDVRAA